jgi:Trk-type K+ transport system membrane component
VRKGVWKWIITGTGVLMLVLSLFILDDTALPATNAPITASGEISIGEIATIDESGSFTLSIDNWLGFFGFILLFVGFFLNNKNITTKNERHAEKITKIRV